MHVLLISHKWNDGREELGLASIEHTYIGSLEQSGLATIETFYLDEYHQKHGSMHGVDDEISRMVIKQEQPCIVLFTWLFSTPKMNLSAEIFRHIKQDLNVPVVLSIHDSARVWEISVGELLLPYVNFIICADGTDYYLKYTDNEKKYYPTWMPLDTRRFEGPELERDYDVSFLGRLYNEREIFLHTLANNGVNVTLGHWTDEANKVPIDQFAEVLRRSKMTLNTSNTGVGDTLKWRAMEATLAGALLLEYADGTTRKYFEPMNDYVPFENEHDLLDKVRYFLAHEDDRKKIARNGYLKAWNHYTGVLWWDWFFKTMAENH